jgi:hypothetical protein
MDERLSELREEYRRGMEEIVRLEQRRMELSRTLLRISGAIQVLEELRAGAATPPAPATAADVPRMQVMGN